MEGDLTFFSHQNLTEKQFKVLFHTLICDPPIHLLNFNLFQSQSKNIQRIRGQAQNKGTRH